MEVEELSDHDLEAMLGVARSDTNHDDLFSRGEEVPDATSSTSSSSLGPAPGSGSGSGPGPGPLAVLLQGTISGSPAIVCANLPSLQSKCEFDVEFDLADGVAEILTGYCLVAPMFTVAALVVVFLILDLLETLLASKLVHDVMPCLCVIMAIALVYGFGIALCECMEIRYQVCTIKANQVDLKLGWRTQQEFHIAFDQLADVKTYGENLVLETKWNINITLRCVRFVDEVREFILARKEQTCCYECCHQGPVIKFNEAA